MKLLRFLPALIFIMPALSYNVRAQYASPNPVCYGTDINLFCAGLTGCGLSGSTYTWSDKNDIPLHYAIWPESGNFSIPMYLPGTTTPNPEYYSGYYFIMIKYPPGLLFGSSVPVILQSEIKIYPSATPVTCNHGANGAISLFVSGGRPFTGGNYIIKWSTGASTKDISGLSAGTYSVTVTDKNNCKEYATVTDLTEPAAIVTGASVTSAIPCFGGTATVTVTASGGSGSFTYMFNDVSQLSGIFSGISANNEYAWSVEDVNCSQILFGNLPVSQPSDIIASASVTTPIQCIRGNATVTITASGGEGFTYTFNGVSQLTGVFTGISTHTGYAWDVKDANGCMKTGVLTVTTSTLFLAGSITANQTICYNTSPSILTGTEPTGGNFPFFYQWQNSLDNETFTNITGSTTINYQPSSLATTTYFRLIQISTDGCSAATNVVIITITPLPPTTSTLTYTTVVSGQTLCYDASQTITIAGGITTFRVKTGGSVNLIAGLSIDILPGTTVEPEGYLHGFISSNCLWCNVFPRNPTVAVQSDTISDETAGIAISDNQEDIFFKVYPNPTAGKFTLEVNSNDEASEVKLEVYGSRGQHVQSDRYTGKKKHQVSLDWEAPGVYFLRVITPQRTGTIKIIRR